MPGAEMWQPPAPDSDVPWDWHWVAPPPDAKCLRPLSGPWSADRSASLVGVWVATEAVLSRDVSEQPPAVTARMATMATEATKCAARVLSCIPPEIRRELQ